MGDLLQFDNGSGLGGLLYAQDDQRIPDEAFFFAGVLCPIVLPQIGIYLAYGGLVPLIPFVGVTLTGVVWGLANYYLSRGRELQLLDTGTAPRVPQARPVEEVGLKKVA